MTDATTVAEGLEPLSDEELDSLSEMFADCRGSAQCCPISGDAVHRLIQQARRAPTPPGGGEGPPPDLREASAEEREDVARAFNKWRPAHWTAQAYEAFVAGWRLRTPAPSPGAVTREELEEAERQLDILRRAAAVPIPDDDADFEAEKARRGAAGWQKIAANCSRAFDAIISRLQSAREGEDGATSRERPCDYPVLAEARGCCGRDPCVVKWVRPCDATGGCLDRSTCGGCEEPVFPLGEEGAVGAAERQVGRYIYRRIERLIDAKPGTPEGDELAFLADIVGAIEEFGEEACGDHPLRFQSPHPGEEERLREVRDTALTEAAAVCRQQAKDFSSPQYATGQPLSSLSERFACEECARAIEALAALRPAAQDEGGSDHGR